jgi:hypothetical protein
MNGLRAGVLSVLIIAPALIAAVWLAASVNLPLGRDQGIFAWAGATVLQGGLPYADAWEIKGPGAHALYALAILLFGDTERAVRYFDVVWQLAALAAFLTAGMYYKRLLAGLLGFLLSIAMMAGSW